MQYLLDVLTVQSYAIDTSRNSQKTACTAFQPERVMTELSHVVPSV